MHGYCQVYKNTYGHDYYVFNTLFIAFYNVKILLRKRNFSAKNKLATVLDEWSSVLLILHLAYGQEVRK